MDTLSTNKRKNLSSTNKHAKKNKKEPIKVVHFSDPIRITTTADEFKRRVQELTGRSSTVADLLFLETTEQGGSEASTGLCSPGESGSWINGTCGEVGLPLDLGLDDVEDCGLSHAWGPTLDDDILMWPAGTLWETGIVATL